MARVSSGAVRPFSARGFARTVNIGLGVSFVAMATAGAGSIYEYLFDGGPLWNAALGAAGILVTGAFAAIALRQTPGLLGLDECLDHAVRHHAALNVATANLMIADENFNIAYVMPALERSLQGSSAFWAAHPNKVDISRLVGKNIDVFHHHPGVIRKKLEAMQGSMKTTIRFDGRTFNLNAHRIRDVNGRDMGYAVEWVETTAALRSGERIAEVIAAAHGGDFRQRIDLNGLTPETRQVAEALYEVYGFVDSYLAEIDAAMSALAHGDLTHRLREDYSGVYGRIARSANEAATRLSETIARLKATGEMLRQSTADIARGSSELSSRAESQAASLEETAATMEEMASTVRSNADNAIRANTQASEASRMAGEGKAIVSDAVQAMDRIEKSSSRIADITSLIDSIAFQTNLLALNASVEAARAGEAGRGFAVVAQEVRTLAQRSADAARQIKTLIDESSTHVGEGVQLVNRSGAALDAIAASIATLAESISEISSASREQSS
ncbi:MAG: methyl-accepting chemotaxis protein, partial [Rubrimonas sp.]